MEPRLNVTPLGARLLVKDQGPMDRSPAGLWMAPDWKEVPREGLVLAAGPGEPLPGGGREPMDVKAGDRIVYGRFAGRRVTLDGTEYTMMHESDVLGLLE